MIRIHDKESQSTASRGWFRVARTLAPLAVDHSNARTAESDDLMIVTKTTSVTSMHVR